jgi:hypothetical protein
MTDPRHYSRWPDPWRSEDDWGPLTAAVLFVIILLDSSSTVAPPFSSLNAGGDLPLPRCTCAPRVIPWSCVE